MISCRDFIPAYSELFRHLERIGGRDAVHGYWLYLSREFLGNLRDHVAQNGIRGCWLYWTRTLNEESADFTMELNQEEGWFRIRLHECPSMKRLIETKHIEPYHDYCRHCEVIYPEVLKDFGLHYEADLSECKQARCSLTVRTNKAVSLGYPKSS